MGDSEQGDGTAVIVLPEYNNIEGVEAGVIERAVTSSDSLDFSALEDDDERFGAYSKVALSWEDLKVSVEIDSGRGPRCLRSDKNTTTKKDILKGLSGICNPGTFMAIMGASGAGKTTLLNTLAMKNENSIDESGSVLMNGKPLTRRNTTLLSAYVQQEDFFVGTLTVKEVLMFHATLRMGRNVSLKGKKKKVNKVMNELGLQKIANSLCGMPGGLIRGISGGERKRLSVACELLMNPPLLFIDEPTSGLDSFMARSIVKLIGKLAKTNRTILCTIHQPTSEVFAMFDKLYLVAEGKCAYTGPCQGALEFFKSAHYPCPANFNPADHYIFTLAIIPGEEDTCRQRVSEITDAFSSSEEFAALKDDIAGAQAKRMDVSEIKTDLEESTSEISSQFIANFSRSWKNVIRNPAYTRIRIFQVIVLALLGGLAYFDVGNNQESVQNKSGLLFYLVMSATFANIFVQSQNIPMDMPIIKREYRNGMYGIVAALTPRFILEMPYLVMLTLIQWGVVWLIAGLQRTFVNFIIGFVACLAVSLISTSVGYFVATAAGSPMIAAAMAPLMILPFFLFGGLYQNEASTPYWFYPIKYASWFRYAFGILIINEFQDTEITCDKESGSTTPCVFADGNQVLKYYNLNVNDIWFPNLFAIVVMSLGYLAFSILFLWLRVREKRAPIKEKTS